MKYKYILLITIFVPTMSFAGFGDQFNSLLEKFFSGEEPSSSEEVLAVPEFESPISDTSIPVDIKKSIIFEENELQLLEDSLSQNEKALYELRDDQNLAQYQLEQLDSDLGAVRVMQEKRNAAVIKWKRSLEEITRKKIYIEADLRQIEQAQEERLSKNFIQSSLQKNTEGIDIWSWVFSNKSISQLIEKRRREARNEEVQRKNILNVKMQRESLAQEERRVADILFHVQELERQSSQQQVLLADLVSARANISARLDFTQGELENAIASARQQQAQSTITLQRLREKLREGDVSEVFEEQVFGEKLSFPLALEPNITAHFLNPLYKKSLGRDHFGTDFSAPQGTPIFAPMDGVIEKVAQNGYAYSYFIIDHGNDLFTLYGHVSDVDVQEGDIVLRGQQIARTGGTPGMPGSGFFTTGPHLHFEVFVGGRHVDAEKWLDI